MSNAIRLGFLTDLSRIAYITVPDAPVTVPGSDPVKAAMQRIIDTDTVRLTAGRLIGLENARHINNDIVIFNNVS